ncbi:MAG: hypothetical protein ACOC1I_04445 [Spirochaetota bacterium]
MTVYRLHLRILREGVVDLRLGWGWRIVFIAVTLVVAIVLVQQGEARGLLPVVGLVSLIASVYQERWRFDRGADLVESRIGLLGLARVRRYRLSSLRAIRVRSRAPVNPDGTRRDGHAKPSPRSPFLAAVQRGYVQLILEFESDDESGQLQPVIVQTEKLMSRERVAMLASELGSALDAHVATGFE